MTSLRILIVEDEPLIAMLLEDFCDALGHSIGGIADSVGAALPLVAADGFDAAILDIHLRDGERAWPIADALIAAGKAFVFASGGHTEPVPESYRAIPTLAKPYTLDGVRAALERLDAPTAGARAG